MSTAYIAVTSVAIAANGFSGVAALVHFKPILPGMTKAGVPVSWLAFPIGAIRETNRSMTALRQLGTPLVVAAATCNPEWEPTRPEPLQRRRPLSSQQRTCRCSAVRDHSQATALMAELLTHRRCRLPVTIVAVYPRDARGIFLAQG
jgi:hypothetical protein